jgi:hypothetical protein
MADASEQKHYDKLCAWSLSRGDAAFVHQLVVDCWAAQHATANSRPISPVFALIGLYLHLEHGYSGRQVQLAHMKLAKNRKQWPKLLPPLERGNFRVEEAFHAQDDAARDEAINRWCASVWESWKDAQPAIRELVKQELGVEPMAQHSGEAHTRT